MIDIKYRSEMCHKTKNKIIVETYSTYFDYITHTPNLQAVF